MGSGADLFFEFGPPASETKGMVSFVITSRDDTCAPCLMHREYFYPGVEHNHPESAKRLKELTAADRRATAYLKAALGK